MGVPKFYKWLMDMGFDGVLLKSLPRDVSSFSIDLNGLLHRCAQKTYAYGAYENDLDRKKYVEETDEETLEREFFKVLNDELGKAIAGGRPQDILVIAVDGVAPYAKINQQRQRRFKTALDSKGKSKFNSSAITPGTEFMKNIHNYLERWFKANSNTTYQTATYQTLALIPDKLIYSSHMEPGEGEHKIMDLMRMGEIKGDGAHVLYGMDADLIVLSLLSPISNIYLMREDVENIINIEKLKYVLQQKLGKENVIPDFAFMTFLIGNDFLPHTPAFSNLDTSMSNMFNIYKRNNFQLIRDKKLNWSDVVLFFQALAENEKSMLSFEAERNIMNPLKILQESSATDVKQTKGIGVRKIEIRKDVDLERFSQEWYKKVFSPKSDNLVKLMIPDFEFVVDPNQITDMVYQYIIGLHWIYDYYTKGMSNVNIEYIYNYSYAPLLTDIHKLYSNVNIYSGYQPIPGQMALNPIYQMLAVLPSKSLDLLPKPLQFLMTNDSPIIDLYPLNFVFDQSGTDTDWQGVVLLPTVDIPRIVKAVNDNVDVNELIISYKSDLTKIIQRTEEQTSKMNIFLTKEKVLERNRLLRRKQYKKPFPIQKTSGSEIPPPKKTTFIQKNNENINEPDPHKDIQKTTTHPHKDIQVRRYPQRNEGDNQVRRYPQRNEEQKRRYPMKNGERGERNEEMKNVEGGERRYPGKGQYVGRGGIRNDEGGERKYPVKGQYGGRGSIRKYPRNDDKK